MNDSPRFVCVNTTVSDQQEAERLAGLIVEKRLAACVQWHPITSSYRWKNRIETSTEFALVCKTRAALSDRLTEFIRTENKYEVPEVIVIPILNGSHPYLAWIEEETTA